MKIRNLFFHIGSIAFVFTIASCSTFGGKDLKKAIEQSEVQNAQLQLLIQDLQKELDTKNAELKKVTKERDDLESANNDLKKSLSESKNALSKRISTLTVDKQALEKKLSELQLALDAQKAKEEREMTRIKSTNDQLIESLKNEINEKQVEIQQYKGVLTINMMDKIFFDSGKTIIKPSGRSALDRVGEILKNLPEKMIQIEGHTDDVPIAEEYQNVFPNNWSLGARRAINVAVYFIDKLKIDPTRIEIISFSKYRPRVPNNSPENRAKNRRIEIVLTDRGLYQFMEMKEGIK
jgi:chemotaxis protein MotB